MKDQCPFDETEPCYRITTESCKNPCGVIRDKAEATDKTEENE